jgi:phosphoserine aminotransferase
MSDIKIPDNLKPSDGRFGCGPSKIRTASASSSTTTSCGSAPTSRAVISVRFSWYGIHGLRA